METMTIVSALEWNPKSRKAVLARVNRFLAKRGEKIVCGVGRERARVGGWYRINEGTGQIVEVFIDLENCARTLGVLAAWEKLEADE
jgi:hypothetical protein